MEDAPPTFRCGHPRTFENTAKNGNANGCCKTCKRNRQRERYAANLEQERARGRERSERYRRRKGVSTEHRNAVKTHCPQGHPYDEENTYLAPGGNRQCKTCRRAAMRRDHEKHRERRLADRKVVYETNRDAVLARNRAWAQANPEKANLNSRLKRQRRRAAGVLTAAEWQSVLSMYGSACLACGSDSPPTIDHVVPISKGGTNTVENVQPLCMDCNNRKGTKTVDYRPGAAVV